MHYVYEMDIYYQYTFIWKRKPVLYSMKLAVQIVGNIFIKICKTRGKCLIHGHKRRKNNQTQSLKHPRRIFFCWRREKKGAF